MIPSAFFSAVGQIDDPRFRMVFARGIGLTVALLIAAYAIVFYGIQWILPESFSLPWIGEIGFVDEVLSWGSVLLMLVLSVFLMVPVATAFMGLFLDDVADAVEEAHYPHLPPAPRLGLSESVREALTFLVVLIVANLAALLLYFTPLAPFVFYGLNGFLLGREYFRMIALRRLGRRDAQAAFRRHLPTIWGAGALMAVPLSIPLVNLTVPILGAATFVHLFHRLTGDHRNDAGI